ncbi:MAG: hypothetical protein ACLSHO_05415 [Dysosmobacter sp.]
MSHEFCGACRRIRVTADGKLKGCLHSREEIPSGASTARRWRTPSGRASCTKPGAPPHGTCQRYAPDHE